MAESSASPFSPVVGGFPLRLLQEVAQLLEFRWGHLTLHFVQHRHSHISFVRLPRFISSLSLSERPALARLIFPDAIPIDQERPAHL
jgi:hypothetical protein